MPCLVRCSRHCGYLIVDTKPHVWCTGFATHAGVNDEDDATIDGDTSSSHEQEGSGRALLLSELGWGFELGPAGDLQIVRQIPTSTTESDVDLNTGSVSAKNDKDEEKQQLFDGYDGEWLQV